jgi:hypothetical protein
MGLLLIDAASWLARMLCVTYYGCSSGQKGRTRVTDWSSFCASDSWPDDDGLYARQIQNFFDIIRSPVLGFIGRNVDFRQAWVHLLLAGRWSRFVSLPLISTRRYCYLMTIAPGANKVTSHRRVKITSFLLMTWLTQVLWRNQQNGAKKSVRTNLHRSVATTAAFTSSKGRAHRGGEQFR